MKNVKIFASIIDEITQSQIQELSSSEAYKDCQIRIMPDCHAGTGCTIGSVIQFNNRVVPNTVGVDIGCGMLVIELGHQDINLCLIDEIIHKYIPSGFNIHETPIVNWDLDYFDYFYTPIKDKQYILNSIGTLGGGNHFIEIDVDDKKNKYLVIHTGSRNLGVQVCKYWQEVGIKNLNEEHKKDNSEIIAKLKAEGRQKEIQSILQEIKQNTNVIPKDLAYIEGKDLDLYLQDMQECQNYAHINRIQIARIILEKAKLNIIDYFRTIHNYIDVPNKIIRKGAIAADKGKKVIIPMNMRDGSLICIGKGNEDWLCSAPHGAGRIMSRNQASEQITMEDFKNSMNGIYTTSVNENTIDEAPMAYKSAEVIQKDIEDTVEIVKVIKPIYNFKAN